jgi:hypothetical protein
LVDIPQEERSNRALLADSRRKEVGERKQVEEKVYSLVVSPRRRYLKGAVLSK